jgi:hypothetical protein
MFELIKNMLVGIGIGVISAGIGYFRKTPVPEFNGKKFVKTLIIGGIVGGAYAYSPIYTEDVTMTFIQELGYITVIDRVADLVWNRFKAILTSK